MKKTKRFAAMLLAAALLVTTSIAGTVAYFTSQDKVVNTFAVGDVKIELDEAHVDEYGKVVDETRVKANDYLLIPGHAYVKDPVVTVKANSETSYVFIDVDNQLVGAIEDGHYTLPGEDGYVTPHLGLKQQITEINGWEPLMVAVNGSAKTVFYKVVDKADTDTELKVFDYFHVAANKTNANLAKYAGKTITVTAYAVQADGFKDAAAAWNAAFAK